jgi:hypothetical protein
MCSNDCQIMYSSLIFSPVIIIIFCVLRIEPRVLHMFGKLCTDELYPQSLSETNIIRPYKINTDTHYTYIVNTYIYSGELNNCHLYSVIL